MGSFRSEGRRITLPKAARHRCQEVGIVNLLTDIDGIINAQTQTASLKVKLEPS